MRQRTLKEYRNIDLALFALMFAVFEFIIVRAAKAAFFSQEAFTVSLAAVITSIVYMRWGAWGGIHAFLAGILYCLYSGGATWQQYIIYGVGNLFSLLATLLLYKAGFERVRTGQLLAMLFPLLVILLMQGGRAAVSLVFYRNPEAALDFFTTDSLSILFTLVIIWIVRRLDGIYENQKHYLLRLQAQQNQ